MWPRPCASTSVSAASCAKSSAPPPIARGAAGARTGAPSRLHQLTRPAFVLPSGRRDAADGDVPNRVPNSVNLTQSNRTQPNNRRPNKAKSPAKPALQNRQALAAPGSKVRFLRRSVGSSAGIVAPSGFETTTNGAPTPRRGPSSLARHRVQRIWPNRAAPRQRFGVRGAVFDALAPGGRNRLGHGDTRGTRWQPRPRDSCAGSRVRRPRRREALPLAPRLRAAVASRRSDRGPHGLGDPRSSGARVREHRGRVAGRRPLRGARRAAAVRRPGQLAGARHGADCGRRGPVGGHGRRPRPGGDGRFAAFTAGLAHHRRRRRPDRGPAAPRLPGQLHQPAGAQGLHHRPGAHDHHRPAAEAVRDQPGDAATSSSRPGTSSPTSATRRADAARRHALAGGDHRAAPARSGRSGPARGRRRAPSPRSRSSRSTSHGRVDRERAARRSACPTSGSGTPGGWPRAASA